MNVEKAGCYKLYRCRSLLACDSGGTVYDTSQRSEDSDGETLNKNADESQNESGQSENIVYIIDEDNKVKINPLSQQTLADTNTCLDDDKFNNYKPCSNINHEPKCDIVQYIKEENVSHDDSCKYYIVQCDDIDSTQNSATETLDSDSFDRENFEYYCDSVNLSSSVEDISVNSNNNGRVSGNVFICSQEEAQFHNFSNFSQKTEESSDLQDLTRTENYSSFNSEIEPIIKHTRKRKQSYKIKSDSFTELLEDDDSSDASSVSEISKKIKSAYSEDNRRRKVQFQKYNPFENLKMSSILKKEHCVKNQIQSKDCRIESLASSNDKNSGPSNALPNDEVFNCSEWSCQSRYSSSFPFNDHFFKIIDSPVRFNSDLTDADYLEYVQPREKIVESDMDKLLSPTIEVEISTIMKHCQINEYLQQAQGQVDCNGNEVNLRENFHDNAIAKTSAIEAVEKQLVSKAVYAIKLGFQNIFNTSNDCVIDEILFDHSFAYKNIQLEIDLVNIRKNLQPKTPLVLLENIDEYLTYRHQLNDPFKNVSCSLQDTLNEFDSFGGFTEDNSNREDKINQTEVHNAVLNNHQNGYHCTNSNASQKQHECIQLKPHSSFNSSVEVNSVSSDINANYDLTKYASSSSIKQKRSIAPLKMRIKRVSDDNQYVIDDSNSFNIRNDKKTTLKYQKNPYSKYECSYCSEKFRTKRLLKSHISENHKGPYDMECEICHMKSKKSSAYKKHKPWCERSTALKCEICQKVYCYKAVLLRHLNTHKD